MNWGKGITLVIIAFMGFILSMVIKAFSKDADLVEEDYYENELLYNSEKDAAYNFENTEKTLVIQKTDKGVLLIMPGENEVKNGVIEFYRPDKKTWDRTFDLNLDENYSQVFPKDEFHFGFYEIKVSWNDGEQDYIAKNELMY